MNVIFLDFDGVLDTNYYQSKEQVEEKVKILADICHTYNAKVVIEAGAKGAIDEYTMAIDEDAEWVNYLFFLFKKYNIEVIGRTPDVKRYTSNDKSSYLEMWKEDEIRLYLMRHPEIDHYCVIDDDDLPTYRMKSDLNKVRNHLIMTKEFDEEKPLEEGLQFYHKEEVGKILELPNEVGKLIKKYRR